MSALRGREVVEEEDGDDPWVTWLFPRVFYDGLKNTHKKKSKRRLDQKKLTSNSVDCSAKKAGIVVL